MKKDGFLRMLDRKIEANNAWCDFGETSNITYSKAAKKLDKCVSNSRHNLV